MTAEEGLEAIKEFVVKFGHDDTRKSDYPEWWRGANYIREQVHALIVEHIEPNLTLPSTVETAERVGI